MDRKASSHQFFSENLGWIWQHFLQYAAQKTESKANF